jgi:hypothetical protein
MSDEITVYSFRDEHGQVDEHTTQDSDEAQEHGQRHGMEVIATWYAPTGSDRVWDFTPKDRLSRLTVALATLGHSVDDISNSEIVEDALSRFALIESSIHDSSLYVTTHDTRQDAADYHDGQECPDYWRILSLVCLDTGCEYDAESSTKFS